jgi:hypothetical protein
MSPKLPSRFISAGEWRPLCCKLYARIHFFLVVVVYHPRLLQIHESQHQLPGYTPESQNLNILRKKISSKQEQCISLNLLLGAELGVATWCGTVSLVLSEYYPESLMWRQTSGLAPLELDRGMNSGAKGY